MATRGADYPKQANSHFATPRAPIASLFECMKFNKRLCDPCCGTGAMLKVFEEFEYTPIGFDLDPWPPYSKLDFLKQPFPIWHKGCDFVCNPPYGTQGRTAIAFIARALEITKEWDGSIAMLLPVDFDSAKTRAPWFRDHPAFAMRIVLLNRIKWFNNQGGSTVHAWYLWHWRWNPSKSAKRWPIIKYVE